MSPRLTAIGANAALLSEGGVIVGPRVDDDTQTTVFVAVDGGFAGTIGIVDDIRPGASDSVALLRAMGLQRVAMLTGDSTPMRAASPASSASTNRR